MKSFALFKIPLILSGISAVLLLAPACKAQSEIAPDHFDGTDSWATQNLKDAQVKSLQPLVPLQTTDQRRGSRDTLKSAMKPTPLMPARKRARDILARRRAAAFLSKQQ
jgi:hypothetical protein